MIWIRVLSQGILDTIHNVVNDLLVWCGLSGQNPEADQLGVSVTVIDYGVAGVVGVKNVVVVVWFEISVKEGNGTFGSSISLALSSANHACSLGEPTIFWVVNVTSLV